MSSKTEAIVVGGGISGLLAALALAKEGKNVSLIEKSNVLGGNARSYSVKGFQVDTGVHAITSTDSGPLAELVDKYFNEKPEYLPHGEYYVRTKERLTRMPWSLASWLTTPLFPLRERLFLLKLLVAGATCSGEERKRSVGEVVSRYRLSARTERFIDMLCYLFTGKPMYETPVWRLLTGSGYIREQERATKKLFSMIKKSLLTLSNAASQGYPHGGVQEIADKLIDSIPKERISFILEEEVSRILVDKKRVCGVETNKGRYSADIVIYSGFMRDLPLLAPELPEGFKKKVGEIEQVESITLWLGLKEKTPWFDYVGSEMWFEEGEYFWAMPTTSYNPAFAPEGMQLVGFTFITKGGGDGEEKAYKTILGAFPGIEEYVVLKHFQRTVPEKGALTTQECFPSTKAPIDGLYLVGTDTDYRSMGLTRAAYSVREALCHMREEGFIF